jgi:23S rRNA pseudouridine1911/1915/1917 synthase
VATTEIRHLIAAPAAGQRLDHALAASHAELSRSRIQNLIKEGHISVNGLTAKPGAKLRLGDEIVVRIPPAAPVAAQPEELLLEVLFEDEHLLVINKPAGMVVHPAAGHASGTLVNALLHHCGGLSEIGGEQRPGIVHRLDRETSGCIVVAKNDAAHQGLSRQFATREVSKIYLALVAGRLAAPSGEIVGEIGRHPVHRKKMTVLPEGRGRASRTSWRRLGEISAKQAPAEIGSVVECTLHTGRTHQIRVHFKHIGHPLLGDEVYGRRLGFLRQMLHAWKLAFTHPVTGRRVECEAPIPEDFLEGGVESVLGAHPGK